jgi:hypothetical protein
MRRDKRQVSVAESAANGDDEAVAPDEDVQERKDEDSESPNHSSGPITPGDGPEGSEHSADDGGMTMFNLVFIMNPHRMDAAAEVADLFEHVAKDINKALRYAQSYSNYVWKESDMILLMKDKAKEKSKQGRATCAFMADRNHRTTNERFMAEDTPKVFSCSYYQGHLRSHFVRQHS